jgi:hypothetical protein
VALETFEGKLVVREHNRWLLGLALSPLLVALFAFAGPGGYGLAVPLTFASIVLAALVLRKNPAPILREAPVRIERGEARIGPLSLSRASIRDAQVVPLKGGQHTVRIWRTRKLPIDLVVRDKAEGREVLRALGFDASQTVTRFRGASRILAVRSMSRSLLFALFFGTFMVLQLILREQPELYVLGSKALGVVFAAALIAIMIPSRIAVGADGLLVSWLGLKWFHPLAKIRRVERYDSGLGGKDRTVGVAMTMEGGHVVRLPMGSAQWNDERTAALLERIAEARETHARGEVDAAAILLGRRERGVRDWIQELRAIGAGANADLRTAPVSPEHLWRIVESHGAEPAERAAAAVALGPSLDDEGKQRLRVAVDTVADERLRIAIDATVKQDDAALEEALSEVSDASATVSRAP